MTDTRRKSGATKTRAAARAERRARREADPSKPVPTRPKRPAPSLNTRRQMVVLREHEDEDGVVKRRTIVPVPNPVEDKGPPPKPNRNIPPGARREAGDRATPHARKGDR